ncbi:MAG TPA: cytochrome B6, partial [Verrucomicrobiae bacterium]|nr:cytochrome B6 [Verrucomicrobiae bacterium]
MKGMLLSGGLLLAYGMMGCAAQPQTTRARPLPDAVNEAQTPRTVEQKRVEQKKMERDDPKRFAATNALPASPAFKNQPEEGKIQGFEFYRDPLNAKRPMQTFDEIRKADEEAKPKVMQDQKKLLEARYDLNPKLDESVKMARGKPLVVGPTAKLKNGVTWNRL